MIIQNDTQRRITQSNKMTFDSYLENNENITYTAILTGNYIKQLKSLDMFIYSSNQEYYAGLNTLFTDITDLNQRLAYNKVQVAVHKYNDSTVIFSTGTRSIKTMLDELNIDETMYKNILQKYVLSQNYDHCIITDDNVIYITSKDYIDNRAVILIVMNISDFVKNNLDPSIKIGIRPEETLTTDLRDSKGIENLPIVSRSKLEGGRYDIVSEELKGTQYFWKLSRNIGVEYYFKNDMSLIKKEISVILFKMILILIILAIATFCIILFFSVRIYRPIGRLRDTFISFGFDNSGMSETNNEIDYIAQQVKTIRNSNKELVEHINVSQKYIKERLLKDILMGWFDVDTIDDDLIGLNMDWLNEENCIVIFKFMDNEEDESNYEEQTILTNKIFDILDEQLKNNFTFEKLMHEDNMCFILRCANITEIKEAVSKVITVIGAAFNINLSAFIGQPAAGVDDIKVSFATASRIIEHKNLILIKNVYSYEDLDDIPNNMAIYPINTELKLISAIERGKKTEFDQLLNYVFKEYIETSFYSKTQRERIVIALVNTINRVLQKLNINISSVYEQGEMLFIEMKMCKDYSELNNVVQVVFDNIFNCLSSKSDLKIEELKDKLIEYIKDNLKKDISLLDISEHFNLSPNYMSFMFKNVMGNNFKDYLSKCKFDRVVEVLNNKPSTKISDLADEIGVSIETLTRMFKKYSGKSPGQYIKDLYI